MALSINTLRSGTQFGDGTKAWVYRTADAHSAIVGANYFNGAAGLLGIGDTITAVSSAAVSSTTGGGLKVYYVSANDGATVTVVAGLGS